ncbi:phosphotransferase [Microlunatus flavus]|uniref:Aminoglycoside phosphotransferase domain-containing protein n=1 Tax=Microlunatus flavus TaxID=1036181 RepID=A0A1H9FPD8_9ACTN|nr:phosphotransferase [Microlunatus flavus]SEQ39745.1 hypothetical protein SAMN05421756_103337 [Microlunatus flavus]
MDEAGLTRRLPAVLVRHWGVAPDAIGRVVGPVGMGSVVVEVHLPGASGVVAKWVPAHAAAALDAGSAVARELAGLGLSTGAPRPTRTGVLSAPLGDGRVALLHQVPGRPLTGTGPDEQRRMAAVLVAPEAFFHDPASGVTSLIDWTGAGEGPLLYDVASALMYLGGPDAGRPFLERYLELAPDDVSRDALTHLPSLRRFRGAVQAAYFSIRLAEDDRTGIDDPSENLQGLHHARRMLGETGLLT